MEVKLTSSADITTEPLASDLRLLRASYPGLATRIDSDETVVVEGDFDICADEKHIDRFQIRIEILAARYPTTVPMVFETNGKIPRIASRHINHDGSACLFVPDARWKHWPIGSDLLKFVSGPVYYYFLAQAYFDLNGKWLFGERPHGDDGVIDYYKEEFALNNLGAVYNFLKLATSEPQSASCAHKLCICGSGQRMGQCHEAAIRRVRENVPRDRLLEVMRILKHLRKMSPQKTQRSEQ